MGESITFVVDDYEVTLSTKDGVPSLTVCVVGEERGARSLTGREVGDLRRWTERAIPRGQER